MIDLSQGPLHEKELWVNMDYVLSLLGRCFWIQSGEQEMCQGIISSCYLLNIYELVDHVNIICIRVVSLDSCDSVAGNEVIKCIAEKYSEEHERDQTEVLIHNSQKIPC